MVGLGRRCGFHSFIHSKIIGAQVKVLSRMAMVITDTGTGLVEPLKPEVLGCSLSCFATLPSGTLGKPLLNKGYNSCYLSST